MSQPILVLFVGIPGSGKTTFARKLAKELGAVLLNSDAIRMAMWRNLEVIQAAHADPDNRKQGNLLTFGAMNYAAEQIVSAGNSVVYDCNANHISERQEKHDIAIAHGAQSVVVRIEVPYDVALKRIMEREAAHDQRQISPEIAEDVLQRFMSEIEEPTLDERAIKIPGDVSFDEQLAIFQSSLNMS